MQNKKKFTELSFEEQDKSKTVKFYVNPKKGITICRLYDRWYDVFHEGVTTCHDCDRFDKKIGREIAFNKARKKELEFNLRQIEKETAKINKQYQDAIDVLEKRTHLNIVYLTGVNNDLNELMNK